MRELECLEVKIVPSYYGTLQINTLQIDTIYNGKKYSHEEDMYQSDAISVLDYCFERARYAITEAIKQKEKL
jgi:hypothetical protein